MRRQRHTAETHGRDGVAETHGRDGAQRLGGRDAAAEMRRKRVFEFSQAEFPKESSSDMSAPSSALSPLSMNIDIDTSSAPRFPVPNMNFSLEIKGNRTEISISSYEDHFLVIATQIGIMGTILYARKDEGVSINPTFNVSVIFGKRDEPMLEACARQLIEHMSFSGSSRPLVLSLGLKDHSTETLKGIISAVIDNCLW